MSQTRPDDNSGSTQRQDSGDAANRGSGAGHPNSGRQIDDNQDDLGRDVNNPDELANDVNDVGEQRSNAGKKRSGL
jgi:hypothetical protein